MRIGLSVTSNHHGHSGREAVSRVLERVAAAAEAGLDHLTFGDHHSVGPAGPFVQNVPMLARALAEWPSERRAGALFLLPMWHPVLLAEQVGTLASMLDAPFVVQTGIGSGAGQLAGMGVDPSTRGDVTDAWLDAVGALLGGQSVDLPTIGVTGARVNPIPDRPVEWWIGSGTGPRPMDRAARKGTAWYATPGLGVEDLAAAVADYRARCASLGTVPRVALRRDVLVADTSEQAEALADAVIGGSRGLARDRVLVGTPETVAEQCRRLVAIGVDDVVARSIPVSQADALRSISLLGQVRDTLVARDSSGSRPSWIETVCT